MRILTWAIRIALFVLLLAFAAKNTDPVTLRFYFGLAWQAPLVALLLAFFAAGALLGLIAMLGSYLAQRREIGRLEKKIPVAESKPQMTGQPTGQPPVAEG
jgi:putative membrane protein